MKALIDMKEIIEDEIKKIAKKGDISPQELDSVYKAVDVLKDIEDLCKKEEMASGEDGYSMDGYSRRMYMPYSYNPVWNRSMDGMSNDYSRNMEGVSRDRGSYGGRTGRDADSDGRYSERGSYDGSYENSYARGRDARGRYTSRDGGSYYNDRGYSRHSEKERMIEMLEMMMNNTQDPTVKTTIHQAMQKLEQ